MRSTEAGSSTTAAVASAVGLITRPRWVHTATVTLGLRRMRLIFQESPPVVISSSSPSVTNHMGVGFGIPSLVKVVNKM
ncbi:Uncharacterised protein [Mycobacteroides abscessus subsp. abscessus]|nr:Uncharacterised protein [Mycobacteroides abscessus subsp. abscessus]